MYIFVTILILLVCVLLILSILMQNPKGGGLSAGFGGMGNQVMGARRATDFTEKTTWTLVISLMVLSLVSGLFMPKTSTSELPESEIEGKLDESMPVFPDGPQQPAPSPAEQPAP